MDFRWHEWNVRHVVNHGVDPDEAEQVVIGAQAPYPKYRGDGKWLVWGQGRGGRYLQVVFIAGEDDVVFVIHARPLTEREKRRYRRARR